MSIPLQTPDYEDDGGPITDRDFAIIERMVPQDKIPGKVISSALHWFDDDDDIPLTGAL